VSQAYIEIPDNSAVKHHRRGTKLWAALLVSLCPLSWTIGAHAQADSAPQLSTFQIQTGSLPAESNLLVGAALSPDGQQVAAAYFDRASANRLMDSPLSVRIWNVGTQEPIASKELPAWQEVHDSDPMMRRTVDAFVQYCNKGLGILVGAPGGNLYYLNPQTLEILRTTATNIGVDTALTRLRAVCAANSPRAVLATYGGVMENGHYRDRLVRVYDLAAGTLIQEWDMTKSPYPFGDVAISPSGNEIAVSQVPTNFTGVLAKAVENLELFDVNTGKVTLQVKTGHLPGRISFVGEGRVATDDTTVTQPFFRPPKIKLWDTRNGKLIKKFGDPKVGARRFVGASSDGNVILGYIPKETLRTARGTDPWNDTLEQQFRLWDVGTGQTIATSPPFLPILRVGPMGLDPSLEVSGNGRAVIVFWKSRREIFPIYVFSVVPATSPQPH
jgi:hypothetical protein